MKVNLKKWYKVTDKLDRYKYHLCTKMGKNGFVEEYTLYKRDMPWKKYMSEENKAILSSVNGNTFKDLKKFIRKNNEDRQEHIRDVVWLLIWLTALLVVIFDNAIVKIVVLIIEWIFLFVNAMLIRRKYDGNK